MPARPPPYHEGHGPFLSVISRAANTHAGNAFAQLRQRTVRKLFASVLDLVVGSAARRVRPYDAALALGIVCVGCTDGLDQP